MTDLHALLERLQSAQRDLIHSAANLPMLPSDTTLRKISDLENTIAAVEALMQEARAEERSKNRNPAAA
jgi:hypothetical protein